MPPITLAFVDADNSANLEPRSVANFINGNIANGYILDGMQRLTTLRDASEDPEFNPNRSLQVNVIIAERYDLLLYRMITLNNGQRPMTARHQIEMLTKGMLDTEGLSIPIVWEKEQEAVKGGFKRADIAEAYTAFLTNSVNNQNSRIIETKLDEILVGKVMDSNITESEVSFHDILELVEGFSEDISAREWLRLGNNLIGFSVGAKDSYETLKRLSAEDFGNAAKTFDSAFEAINVSKINVGKTRRELSALMVRGIDQYVGADTETLLLAFHDATAD
jgi:hypothetical protein